MSATETSGTVLAISQVSLGDVFAADATAGDTTITVDDAADFAESGGTVLIAGQLVDYTSVDDETGTMILVDPLAADAAQGDRVDLAGPDGSVAIEWHASVEPVGAVDNDDAIDATISYALIPLLPEGIRDPGTGESVTLTLDGSEWQVTNVHGQQPDLLADNLASPVGPVAVGDTTGNPGAIAISGTNGSGGDSSASGVEAVAVGLGSDAAGRKAVAMGSAASASGANAIAVGDNADASGSDSAALGNGVSAPNPNDWVIGTTNANVQIQGALIIADQSTGDMYRLDATGGVLTLVAYP